MSNGDEHELSGVAREIAAALAVVDGQLRLSDEQLARFAGAFEVLPREERRPLCRDLLALGLELSRLGEEARPALGQLMHLCSVLLVSGEAARALFDAAGLDAMAKSAAVTGAEVSKRPVGGARVPGAVSPLGARFGQPKKP